jgi:CBS domain containing-hemolysin-like protein
MEPYIALIGLILSFFFAGSETAFISTNKIRFEAWFHQQLKGTQTAEHYFSNPDLFLSTTLVGNNLANIIASTYAMIYLILFMDETVAWALITLCLLVFGEIVPKVLFRTHANSIILKVVFLIRIFHVLLSPLIVIANRMSSWILRGLKIDKNRHRRFYDKKDLEVVVREAQISGIVDQEEHQIIKKVLSFPETLVREAMVPRTAIKAIEETASVEEIRFLMSESGVRRIPVYKNNIDNIIGVVFLFDLFSAYESLAEIIKPIAYAPENKHCNELLREFKATNTSIAVVIDEYGGTAGLVTLEDVIEELFGDFEELPLEDTVAIRALNQNTFQVKGWETVEHIREQVGLPIDEGNYETIAGFIIARLGHIPKIGEKIYLPGFRISIMKATKKKIEEVRIVKS